MQERIRIEERIQIKEPCTRFPNGLFTGDILSMCGVAERKNPYTVVGPVEWHDSEMTIWPPQRKDYDGIMIPYKQGMTISWAHIDNVLVIESIKSEANGQLLMF